MSNPATAPSPNAPTTSVTYADGDLIAVRGAGSVALIDDRGSASDASFALIAAASSGNSAVISAATDAAEGLAGFAVAWQDGADWHLALSGSIALTQDHLAATTTTVAKPGAIYRAVLAAGTERIDLHEAGGEWQSTVTTELVGGAVRASTVAIALTGVHAVAPTSSAPPTPVELAEPATPAVSTPPASTPPASDPPTSAPQADVPTPSPPVSIAAVLPPSAEVPAASAPAAPPVPDTASPVVVEPVAAAPIPEAPVTPPAPVETPNPAQPAPPSGPPSSFQPPTPAEASAPSEAPPTAAPSSAPPMPDSPSTARIRLMDLDDSPVEAAPLPVGEEPVAEVADDAVLVLGIRCPADHHNHPDALYCSQCGRRMGVNMTAIARPGPRPPLGIFLIDDVATYSIAGDFIIGREPESHPEVIEGLSALQLDDESLSISRAHAAIRLDGWDVTAVDLGSANGTLVRRAGSDSWEPVGTEAPTRLGAGDALRIGEREMQLELHHVQT